MSTIGQVALLFADKRVQQIKNYATNPLPVQEKQLISLVKRAQKTLFGRKYQFKDIACNGDYQEAVPLFDYERMKEWWNEYFEGNSSITWPGKTCYWGLSSGTTSGNKLLPVTADTIRTNRLGGRDTLAFYLHRSRDTKLLEGKMLFLGGSTTLQESRNGTFIGDNTGIMARHIPFYTRPFYSPGLSVAMLSNWEEKIAQTIAISSTQDIRLISGVPSWISLMLESVLAHTGKETVKEVWPSLSVYIHGGMSFKPYSQTFATLIGKPITYVDTYTATEGGMMGIQDRDQDTHMILITDLEVFYEFIPVEDLSKENPRRLTVDTVECGKNYAVAVSTNAGIWSYLIGDVIQFVSVFPHRFFFSSRTKTSLNAFGEHVTQEEMDAGIASACKKHDALVADYTVIPHYPKKDKILPRHRWLVEFKKPADDPISFITDVDEYIKSRNEDYQSHRNGDFGIDFPDLIILKQNTFYQWLAEKGKIGGQHKVPRVLYGEEEFETLLSISNSLN